MAMNKKNVADEKNIYIYQYWAKFPPQGRVKKLRYLKTKKKY